MFLNFINSLKIDIARQTELLEACDWSEEDLSALLQHTSDVIFEIEKSNILIDNFAQFEALFINKMSVHVPERQICIVLKNLKNSLQSSDTNKEVGC